LTRVDSDDVDAIIGRLARVRARLTVDQRLRLAALLAHPSAPQPAGTVKQRHRDDAPPVRTSC
jgi:hypothetical protein